MEDFNKMQLTLVRHGETDYNIKHIVQGGGSDIPLNDAGHTQAQALAPFFKNQTFDEILVSPMIRTLETVKDLLGADVQFDTDDRLKEMNFGQWEGQSITALRAEYPGCFDRAGLILPEYVSIAHGETYEAVRQRTSEAAYDALNNNPDGNVLFVSHGSAIRAMTAELMRVAQVQQFGQIANVGVVHFDMGQKPTEELRLDFYNRTYIDY
ncbi:hypothetical protein FC83_GL000700 [Agrilactobacillus composti DSM 18527 = JCM 14202]|uniref:Phosphoglycerate mutase n=2 Tax=Agrilactobacillus TaxID=2767875 RepID=A0A0R1XNW5_9LACO|nr:hypothetical protein FC83_GL000700 [Agrilactobacillus composti DSM 18527 = JCM 14202]